MLKVCVIGLGHIGTLHASIYDENESVELIGVCDRAESRAVKASKRFDVPYYLNARDILSELKPDICSVATGGFEYSSDHFEPVMQALDTGCHVLVEKPISDRLSHAKLMVEKASSVNRCLAVDMNHRFTPAARTAKQWQEEGKVGDLLFCNMALWIGRPTDPETPFYHLKALNPHSVDIMRYFCGDIKSVQCFAMKAPGRNIWSSASINMLFENGAVGHLTSSYDIARGHPMERCEVAGTNGRIVFEDMWREATLFPSGNPVKTVYTNPVFGGFSNFDDTFRDRINSFVRQICEGVNPDEIDGSGLSGLKASTVIHAAIESIKNNNAVIHVADVTE